MRLRVFIFWLVIAAAWAGAGGAAEGAAGAAGTTRLPKVGILPTLPSVIFTAEVGARAFSDADAAIEKLAPELVGLNGVRVAKAGGTVELDTRAPVQLLVGMSKQEGNGWLKFPGKEPVIVNGATIAGAAVDVYAVPLDKGKRVFNPGAGAYVILGVIPADVRVTPRDAKGGVGK